MGNNLINLIFIFIKARKDYKMFNKPQTYFCKELSKKKLSSIFSSQYSVMLNLIQHLLFLLLMRFRNKFGMTFKHIFGVRSKFILYCLLIFPFLFLVTLTACGEEKKDASLQKKYSNPNVTLILDKDRIDIHRILLQSLGNSKQRNDFINVARINSYFANEAFTRSRKTLDFWMTEIDPQTYLFAEHLKRTNRIWATKNSAADLFPFLVISAHFLNENHIPTLQKTLQSERKLSGPMPLTIDLNTDSVVDEKMPSIIFGASEYCKDGLIAVTDRLGKTEYYDRMLEIIDAIFKEAYVETEYGKLPSTSAEVNGDLLQVICRLYWATNNEKYRQWAEQIGDFYLLKAIPENSYFPPYDFDPDAPSSKKTKCQLRDHGNEIIPGLAELYLIEVIKKGDRENKYYTALKKMLDKLLQVARNEDGLWYDAVDSLTEKPIDNRICDNWGYLYNGYYTFYLACEKANRGTPQDRQKYIDAIKQTIKNLDRYKSFEWEYLNQDGYADSIESALYMLNRLPSDKGFEWVDDEIQIMFAKQSTEGFVEANYLDGNYIRTLLLFAFYKTQGTYIKPWREDVLIGAFQEGKKLYVHIENDKEWKGKLFFDIPRHREFLNLPINYPRVNEWTEWFVVDEKKEYKITDYNMKETKTYSGDSLRNGIDLNLKGSSSIDLIIE